MFLQQLAGKYYYVLSFDNSSMTFDADKSLSNDNFRVHSYYSIGKGYINILVWAKVLETKIAECVELQEASVSKKRISERIGSQFKHKEKVRITDLLTLNNDLIIIKGTYCYSPGAWEYHIFGIMLQDEDIFLIEESTELLRVLLIDGKYYFVTHWKKEESGGECVYIYRFEKGALIKAFDPFKKGQKELVEGVDFVYVPTGQGRMKVDAKEHDPKYKDVLREAWDEADKNVKVEGLYHYDVAALQKKILKEKYSITWRSIYELNPEMIFD